MVELIAVGLLVEGVGIGIDGDIHELTPEHLFNGVCHFGNFVCMRQIMINLCRRITQPHGGNIACYQKNGAVRPLQRGVPRAAEAAGIHFGQFFAAFFLQLLIYRGCHPIHYVHAVFTSFLSECTIGEKVGIPVLQTGIPKAQSLVFVMAATMAFKKRKAVLKGCTIKNCCTAEVYLRTHETDPT